MSGDGNQLFRCFIHVLLPPGNRANEGTQVVEQDKKNIKRMRHKHDDEVAPIIALDAMILVAVAVLL